jgi:hypothetical protein
MKRKAKDLVFISRIIGNGLDLEILSDVESETLQDKYFIDDEYKLNCLSISNKTYIASGFNSYVVKLKSNA